MRRHAFVFAILSAASGYALAGTASAAGLPSRPAPAGLRSVDDGGGRILSGTIDPAPDGPSAFRSALRRANGYFAKTLTLENAVRSNDGKTLMGVFHARLSGVAVEGLAIAGRDAVGRTLVAVLFDEPSRFRRSMGRLVRRLQTLPLPVAARAPSRVTDEDAAVALAARVPTTLVTAQDGTVSARIPQGWQVRKLGEGALVAVGPGNSSVISGFNFNFADPSTPGGSNTLAQQRYTGTSIAMPLTYSVDAGRVYATMGNVLLQAEHKPQATYHVEQTHLIATQSHDGVLLREVEVVGSQEGGGEPPARYDAILTYGPPGPQGLWNIAVSGIAAPASRYRELEPQMLAIVRGYHFDNGARSAQVRRNGEVGREITARGWASVQAGIAANERIEAQNQAKVDASMASARAVQDGIDRSTAGFVRYLSGTDVVRNTSLGADAVVSQSASDALTRFDPQHYASVPVSQYVKGVDY